MNLKSALRKFALDLEGAEEGIACAGTAIESRTIKVGGKAFLFLGAKDIRLKLTASIAAAKKLAKKNADLYTVGAGGWTKIALGGKEPPLALLEGWALESYVAMKPAKKKR